LAVLTSFGKNKRDADNLVGTKLSYYVELQRDLRRAGTNTTKNATIDQLGRTQAVIREIQREVTRLQKSQTETLAKLNRYNESLWNDTSEANRSKIVTNVEEALNALDPKSRLRVAIYAVAAIPEEYPTLNKALRAAIANSRQLTFLKPPGATQVWGLA